MDFVVKQALAQMLYYCGDPWLCWANTTRSSWAVVALHLSSRCYNTCLLLVTLLI
jgi:hypothetical protein